MSLDLASRDRAFIIAEAGTCHAVPNDRNWRLRTALRYVKAAQDAGADAVKFQMFNEPIRDDMFCWIDGDEEREQGWRDSVMPLAAWHTVKDIAEDAGLVFLASVFQHSTVEWLRDLKVQATKVASRAAKDFPYDRAPAPFLISMGMEYQSRSDAIYLECESKYPSTAKWSGSAKWGSVDYSAGFSDHSGTPWRAIDALARDCKLIEVHFYINADDAGPNLPASLTLDQLTMVCEARDAFAELRRDE